MVLSAGLVTATDAAHSTTDGRGRALEVASGQVGVAVGRQLRTIGLGIRAEVSSGPQFIDVAEYRGQASPRGTR